jgi:hypothetical protein
VMALPSHADDGAADAMLAVARCRCRVMVAMTLPRRHWPWCDVATESCW